VYCQVDRTVAPAVRTVDLGRLGSELHDVLRAASDGSLYLVPPFDCLTSEGRGIRDIALSGDGEPTAAPEFPGAVAAAAEARRAFGLDATKLVLVTNATCLTVPRVRDALRVLDENNGEIWAKLDAGTEEAFHLVNRSSVGFRTVLDGILDAARVRPVVIQTLWYRRGGQAPSAAEIAAYCDRLNELVAAGARFRLIQAYTIARAPAESTVRALTDRELDAVAGSIRACAGIPVQVYYGADAPPSSRAVAREGVS
jgi:wyosine [tRNA(Phe)-imidazoG37] synthetase (radical SAM superfamily)